MCDNYHVKCKISSPPDFHEIWEIEMFNFLIIMFPFTRIFLGSLMFAIESHIFGLEIKFRIDWYKTVLQKMYSSPKSLFTETLLFRFPSDFRPILPWWKHWHKLWLIPEYVYKFDRFLLKGAWFIDDLA